jgi:hypothetical protein
MTNQISTDDVQVLREEIVRQRAQLQRLEDALRNACGEPSGPAEQTVSRRGLLAGAAGGLVGAGIAAVAAAQPAAAATGDDFVLGEPNTATDTTTLSAAVDNAPGLDVTNTAETGTAVHAKGFIALYGEAGDEFGTGVVGFSKRDNGVFGQSQHGTAVLGTSFHGDGVGGSSTDEYGVVASGGRAPLRLVPGQGVGAPSHGKHKTGELYVDSEGSLFFCVKLGHHGGTWVRLAHR